MVCDNSLLRQEEDFLLLSKISLTVSMHLGHTALVDNAVLSRQWTQ